MDIVLSTKVSSRDAILLMRNLTMTLKSGVPITRALELFEEEAPRSLRPIAAHLRRSTEQGHTLADAMESSRQKFSPLVVNLVRTGEEAGTLEESIEEVVDHLMRSRDLKRKIRSAMLYPTFVLIALLGLGLSIGTLVLPKLIPLFETLDVELPFMTVMLLKIAFFFEQSGIVFSIGMIAAFLLFGLATRLESMKPLWHRFILSLPYIRQVVRSATVAQMTRTLATLLRSGIPIQEAMLATTHAVDNRVFRRALAKAVPVVQSGRTLSEGLRSMKNVFPGMTNALIDIGEETGSLIDTLEYLADYYEAEVEYDLKNLTTALEPLLLIFVGILVGAVVLAIITPIYEVTGSIR